ncbi:hypothetical protein Pyn_24436 [Prunus yedoensis var. nudiflora]|uniref:Uncharacterized protein n=1 Tax=Prunus yedoensis var. nudiflora TaxID=2094558 RepID=A0A314ZIB0_PRUYE|nr:hypothetical protein Pyn_24436 [Prunus yedoensis var. nudiflora]
MKWHTHRPKQGCQRGIRSVSATADLLTAIWLNQMKGVHHKQLVHQIVKYEQNVVEKGEEIDRALLWKYAHKDKNGEIVDKEVALMAEKIKHIYE